MEQVFSMPKCPRQSPTIELLNQKLSKSTLGYAKSSSFEKKPIIQVKHTMSMIGGLLICLLEIFILGIQPLNNLKIKDFRFQGREKEVPS